MSFLKNLFKRKPGGTALGNLIRGAVKQVPIVGSFLGNGAMMISQTDADKRDLSDEDFYAKYCNIKENLGSDGSVVAYIKENIGAGLAGAVQGVQNYQALQGTNLPPAGGNIQTGATKSVIATYLPYVIGFVLAAAGIIFGVFKRRK